MDLSPLRITAKSQKTLKRQATGKIQSLNSIMEDSKEETSSEEEEKKQSCKNSSQSQAVSQNILVIPKNKVSGEISLQIANEDETISSKSP